MTRLVRESAALGPRTRWYTALLSKKESLPAVVKALKAAGVVERRIVPMAQGNKISRIAAWGYAA